jgi:hypothetical protein
MFSIPPQAKFGYLKLIELLMLSILTASAEINLPSEMALIAAVGNNINGLALNNPQCLAVNPRKEEFIVADALNDRIIIIDTSGTIVFAFPTGENRHSPFGVAVDSSGEIIVSPMDRSELWIFDFNGQFIDSISLENHALPGRLLISHDKIFLVDRRADAILAIDRSGRLLKSYKPSDPNCKLTGLELTHDDGIIAISCEGTPVTAFNNQGDLLYKFGAHGGLPNEFSHPTTAFEDNKGRLWVVDSFRHQVKRFDARHKFIDSVGDLGIKEGELFFPVDIKMTREGKLGILEKGSGRLQIFRLKNDK